MPDFTKVLRAFDGSPAIDNVLKDNTQINTTLGLVCRKALLSTMPGEKNGSWEDQFKRHMIADRIERNPRCDITAEEITLLKERIATIYGPLVTGQCVELLDPAYAAKMIGTPANTKAA
jgi:hypothetical protein